MIAGAKMSDARAANDELEKILASSAFANSPRMRRFLAFVIEETCNGRASRIKEYAIALEVFDKPPDYDPRTDSTVRTEATKLRARLARYYADEGASDTLVISIPKGTYVPVFQELPGQPATASDDSLSLVSAPQPPRSVKLRTWPARLRTANFVRVTAVSLLLAVVAGVVLDWRIQRQRRLARLEAKGSVLMDTWVYENIYRGIDYYRQAVSLDPESASAYSKIAIGYLLLSDLYMAPREAMPRSALAAARAIDLNRQLSDPHIALGMVKLQFDWDWPGAEKELKTAVTLDPKNPLPHQQYGWYLVAEGQFSQADGEMKYASALDSSSESYWQRGLCYYFARQFEDAAEQARRAIAVEPKSYWPHMVLGWTMEQQSKFDEAISEMTIASQLTDSPQAIAALAHANGIAGRHKEVERLLHELTALSKRRYVSPYDVATVYAGNADTEQTLTFLEKAYEDRSGWLPLWLNVDPKFDGVRGQAPFFRVAEACREDQILSVRVRRRNNPCRAVTHNAVSRFLRIATGTDAATLRTVLNALREPA